MAADTKALERIAAHLTASRISGPARKDIIRVSSAGECSRKIGYKLLGFPAVEPTVNELVTFEVGHSYHHMLQKWLMEMGWIAGPEWLEFPLGSPAMRVQGSCDGITVKLNSDGEPDGDGGRRLIEIKSITNVAQERYGKESAGAFTRLDKPRDYHLDQANTYAYLWNRIIEENAPFASWEGRHTGAVDLTDKVTHITMIYVGKDTSDMPLKVFTQPVSQKRIDRLIPKFETIWNHVDREELPPRDHNPFSSFPPCSFCPYQTLCISDGEQ